MRVLVFKPKRFAAPIALCMCFAVLIVLAAVLPRPSFSQAVISGNLYSRLDENDRRLKLLESFGLETEEVPYEVVQVTIPRKFDAVYEAYNDLQKPLGLDLSAYRGKTVKRYTYVVTNIPENGTVYANLLVSEDKLIGGDVSSADPSGFARSLAGG